MDVDETEMIVAAKAGDPRAFGWLADRHWTTVVASVRHLVPDVHAAQDVAQEAFLRAFRHLSRLDGELSIVPWLRRVARNIAVDRARRVRQAAEVELEASESGTLAGEHLVRDVGDRSAAAAVWSAISTLPSRDRQMVLLRYANGLSHEQLARECGISVGAVKISLHRTRRRLRRLVAGA